MFSDLSEITLVSCDGDPFVVEGEVALQSLTLKHLIEDGKIPLPVTSEILSKVIDYCKHQVAAGDDECDSGTSFVQVDKETLAQLHQAAEFLEIPSLRDLTIKAVDDMRKSVKQYKVPCDFEDSKREMVLGLNYLLGRLEVLQHTIVFVKSWGNAMELHDALVLELFKVGNTHAAPTQEDRDSIVNGFKEGETHVLITTDEHLAGFDFFEKQVNVVVNYDLPVKVRRDGSSEPDYEVYVQRLERAGRFGISTGAVFNLFITQEIEEEMMNEIENHFSATQTIGQITEVDQWGFQKALQSANLFPELT